MNHWPDLAGSTYVLKHPPPTQTPTEYMVSSTPLNPSSLLFPFSPTSPPHPPILTVIRMIEVRGHGCSPKPSRAVQPALQEQGLARLTQSDTPHEAL